MPNSNDKQSPSTSNQQNMKDKDSTQSQTGKHQLTQEEAKRGGENSHGQQGSSGESGQHRAQDTDKGSQQGGRGK